ncbi:MAG: M23 family metallopeptidase [Gemmatimonadales bacterium]
MNSRKPILIQADPEDADSAEPRRSRRWLLVLLLVVVAGLAGGAYYLQLGPAADPVEAEVRVGRTLVDTLGETDTFADLLARNGVAPATLLAELSGAGIDPAELIEGTVVTLQRGASDSAPTNIRFHLDDDHAIDLRFEDSVWRSRTEAVGWSSELVALAGRFTAEGQPVLDSAALTSLPAGVRESFLTRLTGVLAWQVNLDRQPRPGDGFRAVATLQQSNDGQERIADIRALRLAVGGRTLSAYRFAASTDAPFAYFDDRGRPLGRTFLRAPLASSGRTSSTYSSERVHPVLGTIRAHRGVDFPAASGTPVVAAAAGMVRFAGVGTDLGNFIEIDHGRGVTTRYGHLSRIETQVVSGSRVRSAQIIGYVGETGLATAPHLHYELRVRNRPIDMRLLDVDQARPIEPLFRQPFDSERARLAPLLDPASTRPGDSAGAR